ncbi:MAG: hypothetical protein AVDCRST_MAG56-20, partial [uncultured Cytophagales bacterium]
CHCRGSVYPNPATPPARAIYPKRAKILTSGPKTYVLFFAKKRILPTPAVPPDR